MRPPQARARWGMMTTAVKKPASTRAVLPALAAAAGCAGLQLLHRSPILYPSEVDLAYYLDNARSWPEVFTWSPFHTFGYPLLLRIGMDAGLSGFTAARVIATASLFLFLIAAYIIARQFLPPRRALAAQVLIVVNWHVFCLGVAASSDLPWAAVQVLALAATIASLRRSSLPFAVLAGALAGLAYDLRPTGLIAVPLIAAFFIIVSAKRWKPGPKTFAASVPLFSALFLLTASPQIHVNWTQQGSPFANGQARNVWFGIHGQGNWAESWAGSEGQDRLLDLIRHEPAAFLGHWAKESAKFMARLPLTALGLQPVLIIGYGGPLMKVLQLSLFTAAGLLLLISLPGSGARPPPLKKFLRADLLVWPAYLVLYGAAVSMAFTTFRFLVVLTPILAAAMVKVWSEVRWNSPRPRAARFGAILLLLAMALHAGWGQYVNLTMLQSASPEVTIALDADRASHDAPIATNRMSLYRVDSTRKWVRLPAEVRTAGDLKAWASRVQARYLVFEQANVRSQEAVTWPELTRDLFGPHPPGRVLYRRDRYLKRVLIELNPKGDAP